MDSCTVICDFRSASGFHLCAVFSNQMIDRSCIAPSAGVPCACGMSRDLLAEFGSCSFWVFGLAPPWWAARGLVHLLLSRTSEAVFESGPLSVVSCRDFLWLRCLKE